MREVFIDCAHINAPNFATLAVINIANIQAWATLTLTVLSIATSIVILVQKLRKNNGK